eukprot:CAMPEP_0185185472 /NCGR_PEP_ID=MMETSP1140-20130426/3331_1 /TAXON_ID=298111 /ORGANISM="Pavlova sp., Strain CCMP459" /LENGTH=139 /DNA_ID=CAMNT_0027751663 /DNA_START=10 /DNA_END=429 /DNA_ORIENTATION=-
MKASLMRAKLAWVAALALAYLARGKVLRNPEFTGTVPERTPLDVQSDEAQQALRYVLTEMKRLSNQYRYLRLVNVQSVSKGSANFNGTNTFLDLEFDMLKEQLSRHDIIVFRSEDAAITGMAIDEFPQVKFRQIPDPDV